MAVNKFLTLNGYELPVKRGDISTEQVSLGRLNRSAKGKAMSSKKAERECLTVTLSFLPDSLVNSIVDLITGYGHVWKFECGLESFGGLKPNVGYTNVRYDAVQKALVLEDGARITFQASYQDECWSAVFLVDGCLSYLDEKTTDNNTDLAAAWISNTLVLENTSGANVTLDALGIFNYEVAPDLRNSWAECGLPPLPCVELSGEILHCDDHEQRTFLGEVISVEPAPLPGDGAGGCCMSTLRLKFCEDDPFYYTDTDPVLLDHTPPQEELCPPEDMILHYPFTADASELIAASDGTLVGTPTFVTDYRAVGAGSMCFDGADDYVDLGTAPGLAFDGLTEITTSIWFNKQGNAPLGELAVILKLVDSTEDLMVYLNLDDTGSLALTTGSAGLGDILTAPLADGWYHLVAYYSTTTGSSSLLINNASLISHSGTPKGAFGTGAGSGGVSCVGQAAGGLIKSAIGYHNDLRLFGRGLSGNELTCNFALGDPTEPAPAPAPLYWFDASQQLDADGVTMPLIDNFGTGAVPAATGLGVMRRNQWVCHPGFELDGSTQSFKFGPDAALDSKDLTFFFVGKPTDKDGFQAGFRNNYTGAAGVAGSNRTHGFYYNDPSNAPAVAEVQGTTPTIQHTAELARGATQVWGMITDGVLNEMRSEYREEPLQVSSITMDPAGHVEVTLGENTSGIPGFFWEGHISEFRIYDGVLTPAQFNPIMAELNDKWLTMPSAPIDTIHHFPLDTDATDAVGAATVIASNPAQFTTGIDGGGYELVNGTTVNTVRWDNTVVSSLLGIGEFDIGFWFKATAVIPNWTAFLRLNDGGAITRLAINTNPTQNRLHIFADLDEDGVNDIALQVPYDRIEDDTWHFVHVSFDLAGDDVAVYIDGVEKPTVDLGGVSPLPTTWTIPTNGAGETWLGHTVAAGDVPNAVIDDLKFWNRNLTQCEVEAEYNRVRSHDDMVEHYFPFNVDTDDVVGGVVDLVGTLPVTAIGIVGNAADHAVVADQVTRWDTSLMTNLLGASTFGWSGWFRSDGPIVTANDTFFIAYDGAGGQMANAQITAASGSILTLLRTDPGQPYYIAETTSTGWDDGNWHHVYIDMELRSQEVRIYIDGVIQPVTYSGTAWTQTTIQGATGAGVVSTSFHQLENPAASRTDFYFDGALDEYRFYKHSLTPGQVQELFERRS